MDKYAKLFVYCPMHEIYKELGKIRNSIIKYVGNPGEESVYQGLKNLNFKELLQELGKTLVISSSDVIKM
jgi:hypothetical protein